MLLIKNVRVVDPKSGLIRKLMFSVDGKKVVKTVENTKLDARY